LDRGRTAKIKLQDPDGRPLSGAVFGSTPPSQLAELIDGTETTCHMLDPKMPRLYAFYHPARKLGARALVGGDESSPLIVRLMPTGTVTGRVVDRQGRPMADVYVSVRFQAQAIRQLDRYLKSELSQTSIGPDGLFRLDKLIPGEVFSVTFVKSGQAW